ncbi:MAG: DUF5317 domain-containing protein, partial [Actinomycetota bacterium]|nr:DUF5317 domain-containing protein [Actinomycetota bacterium]
ATPLDRQPLRTPVLLVAAAVVQVAVGVLVPPGPAYVAGLTVVAVLAAAFLARNAGRPGVPLVAAGLVLNAVAVAVNGGAMPVSRDALDRAGVAAEAGDVMHPRHEPVDADTRLRALADVIPVPLPVRPEVVSAGDVLVASGVGLLVLAGLRPQPMRRRTPGRPPAREADGTPCGSMVDGRRERA